MLVLGPRLNPFILFQQLMIIATNFNAAFSVAHHPSANLLTARSFLSVFQVNYESRVSTADRDKPVFSEKRQKFQAHE
jgi:hypothetical protein